MRPSSVTCLKNLSSLQHREKLFQEICYQLKLLETELMHCFPNIHDRPYISNPFFVDPSVLPVGTKVRKMHNGTGEQ